MQPILTVPNDILRQKSQIISAITPDIREAVLNLEDTLRSARNPEGVGLSFPQIGQNLRGFATYLEKRMRIYLNPEVIDQSKDLTLGGTPDRPVLEGCLSIPHLYGPVYRPKKIKIRALDERGVEFTRELTSFSARVFMHEWDHLESILFTDYTLRDSLPLYLLDREHDQFTQIQDPTAVIKW